MSTKSLRLLLVEDNPDDADLLGETLADARTGPFELTHVERVSEAIRRLECEPFDVVLLDLCLPDSQRVDTFVKVHQRAPEVPIVVLSSLSDEDVALRAVQEGAQDYLVKDGIDGSTLVRSVRYAIERSRRREAERELRATEAELNVARQMQQALFPDNAPELRGFDIAGRSYPARATGGDYFDYIRMAQPCVGIVVADVSGHGIGPSLLMAETRAYLRALALTRTDVDEILTEASRFLAEDASDGAFVAVSFAQLDPIKRTLVYAGAGLSGYLLGASGSVRELSSTGLPLGLVRDKTKFCAPPISLEPGQLVLLLTDGVVEAQSPEGRLFGIDRVLELVRAHRDKPAAEVVETVYEAARSFAGDAAQADDITAVVIKVDSSR